jgi:hypothetical protein
MDNTSSSNAIASSVSTCDTTSECHRHRSLMDAGCECAKCILFFSGKDRNLDSIESLGDLISTFKHEVELRGVLHEWHLNTVKSRACSLAVWAVDQGNRKVYEMERTLMAENSWIARSIVWDGYSQHPLTGITNSKWFWASSAAAELGEDRIGILCEQLQVVLFNLAPSCRYPAALRRARPDNPCCAARSRGNGMKF